VTRSVSRQRGSENSACSCEATKRYSAARRAARGQRVRARRQRHRQAGEQAVQRQRRQGAAGAWRQRAEQGRVYELTLDGEAGRERPRLVVRVVQRAVAGRWRGGRDQVQPQLRVHKRQPRRRPRARRRAGQRPQHRRDR
jgi:hypothetical protein